MLSFDFDKESVFETNIEEMSTEFLEQATDEFVVKFLVSFFGEEGLKKLSEDDQARFATVLICDRFIKMMYERSVRFTERQNKVDWLNSLIDR
jgi:hypothetical protein